MFSRRKKKPISHRLRDFFWPKIGWKNTLVYYKNRIFRLSDTSYSLALGVAVGVGVSFLPVIGLHLLLTAALCLLTRSNIIAGFVGTLIGNPATFPLIWVFSYLLGCVFLGMPPAPHALKISLSIHVIENNFYDIFLPMLLGGSILGLIAGSATYYPLKKMIDIFKEGREDRKRKALERRRKMMEIIKHTLHLDEKKPQQRKKNLSNKNKKRRKK